MTMIRKTFVAQSRAINAEAGIYEAMISTESTDRQGDIVRATGAQLANFLKNPVVLFGHDYNEPPIAKALSVEILPGRGLKSTFQFPTRGISRRADEVRALWDAGFLNATSIGFIPLASKPLSDSTWGPQEFTSWELLEFSVVVVPANAEALRLAMKTLEGKNGKGSRKEELDPQVAKLLMVSLQLLELRLLINRVK